MADKLEYKLESLFVLVKDGKFVMGGGSSTRPSLKIYKSLKMAESYAKRYGARVHEYVSKEMINREDPYKWSWEDLEDVLSVFDHVDVTFSDGAVHPMFGGSSGVTVLRVTDVGPTKRADGKVILHISTDTNWFGPGVNRIFSDEHIDKTIDGQDLTDDQKKALKQAFGTGREALPRMSPQNP